MSFGGVRRVAVFFLFVLAVLAPLPTHAFCGFYVNTGKEPLFNEATRVALMRAGMRTVLSIQNDYKGPLESFALVVPVPVVLERANVRTLPRSIFERVDRLTGPRLVEYWEENPCPNESDYADNKEGGTGARAKGEEGSMGGSPKKPLVTVERQFSVDEYDIVVLSARDSGALETWLNENHYVIPPGAEPYFRPYVAEGSKFFVAKVDIGKVKFRWGRAQLSPLRFFYDAPDFTLPIRLGLINSNGVQDLIVYILAGDRYETANYENMTIPTNLGVKDEVRGKFNSFYGALFDETVAKSKRAVVTEYAWTPESCDPCPEGAGPLSKVDTDLLGADVIGKLPSSWVVTRLHARLAKSAVGDDLVFKAATPITGGREVGNSNALEHGAQASNANNFQGRYIIRHLWDGPVTCSNARFGRWGGMSPYGYATPPPPLTNPHADRNVKVSDYVLDIEEEHRLIGGSQSPTFGSRVMSLLRIDQWETSSVRGLALILFLVGFVASALIAWRRKLGVWKTLGLFLLVSALGFAVAHGAIARSFGDTRVDRAFRESPFVFVALAIAATGFSVARPERRVFWGFFVTLAGLAETVRELFRLRTVIVEAGDITLDQLGRIYSESMGEEEEVIALGCVLGGVLALVALLLQTPRGGKWQMAAGMVVVAAVLRGALLGGDIHVVDVLVVLAFAVTALVVVRTERLAPAVMAITAFVLVDLASKLMAESRGLVSAAGESLLTPQVTNVLLAMRSSERKHLLLIALDIALLIALAWKQSARASDRRVDWRVLAGAALLILAPALSFDLFGFRERLRSLDSAPLRSAALSGPALYLRDRVLLAAPSAEERPVPYTPAIAEKMAAAENGISPLLFTNAKMPIADVLTGLEPLLRGQQMDYRVVASADPPPELEIFGRLVATRGVEASSVQIAPAIDVVDGVIAKEIYLASRWGTAFRDDGEKLTVRTYFILPEGIHGYSGVPKSDAGEVKIDEPDYELKRQVQRNGARDEAIVAFPPNTSLERVSRVLSYLHEFDFGRVVISPDVAALDRLR